MVTLDAIRAAATRVAPVVSPTPLVTITVAGGRVALKCEHLTAVRAFKLRGAYNVLSQLSAQARAAGVVTYSSGNHAQAVAFAAQRLGLPAVVVMPTSALPIKVARTRAYGAQVVLHGTTSLERLERAEVEVRERGLTMVPPFDHPDIVAGAGTVGLEIVGQAGATLRRVFVPVGGGGLLAGVAAAVKALAPHVSVIGVEPVGAACMRASLAAGRLVTLSGASSMADGLLPLRPGDLPFRMAQKLVHEVRTVPEEAIALAMRRIYDATGQMVEPSAAVALAGAMNEAASPGVVAVVTGGNIDEASFRTLVADVAGTGTFPEPAPSKASEHHDGMSHT